ncbi:hypothetical protein B0H65DRAFT_454050 [Neurospora tetraspora]|uniref:Secreted protein n=1 Tax=Neurospora tetraspora TaxID=94610 RepID=A0AAE0JRK3_9PEZI|nr:hypothetical protein B0H65DRAFT_454050 [Neurospora tetraspora]
MFASKVSFFFVFFFLPRSRIGILSTRFPVVPVAIDIVLLSMPTTSGSLGNICVLSRMACMVNDRHPRYGLWPCQIVSELFSPFSFHIHTHCQVCNFACRQTWHMCLFLITVSISDFIHNRSIAGRRLGWDALLLPCVARKPVSQQVPVRRGAPDCLIRPCLYPDRRSVRGDGDSGALLRVQNPFCCYWRCPASETGSGESEWFMGSKLKVSHACYPLDVILHSALRCAAPLALLLARHAAAISLISPVKASQGPLPRVNGPMAHSGLRRASLDL